MTVPRALGMRSLERRLPLLISALVLVVVAAYCVATYRELRASDIASTSTHLGSLVRQLGASGADFDRMQGVAGDSAIRLFLDGAAPASDAAARLRYEMQRDSTCAYALRSIAHTRVRLDVGRPLSLIDEARLNALIDEAAHADVPRRSPLHVVRDRTYFWTVVPVRAAERTVGHVGELCPTLLLANAEEQMRQLTGQEIVAFIANRSGDVWVTFGGKVVPAPFDLGALGPTFRTTTRAGEPVLGSRADVASSSTMFVLTVSESAILQRPREFLSWLVIMGIGLLFVGSVGAWLLGRYVTRPLRSVIDASDLLTQGDYASRVTLQRADELGRLGAAFNTMAERMGESHRELAVRAQHSSTLARELEQRNSALNNAQDLIVRAVMRTDRLQSVTGALAGALDVNAVASTIVTRVVDAAEAHAGIVLRLEEDGKHLRILRSAGYPASALAPWERIPISANVPLAEAARSGTPVFIESPANWSSRYGVDAPTSHVGSLSWAVLPLHAGNRLLGVLGLSFPEVQSFDGDTRGFLVAIGQQCAQALERASLYGAAVEAQRLAEAARREAQSANAAKTAFLNMMSHELRTPLNSIGGYTDLLELGVRGPITDAQREDLTRIRRNQQHLLSVINDILNLSSIEAGRLAISSSEMPVAEVVAELEALVGPSMSEKGIRYELRACAPDLIALADPERVRQILVNLLSNAVRFTERGGTVTVSCSMIANSVAIHVADTGIGIPADRLDTVFERFVRVEAGLAQQREGVGLGLSLSRELAQAMGGTITVQSVAGKGSVFTLEIPRASSGAPLTASR